MSAVCSTVSTNTTNSAANITVTTRELVMSAVCSTVSTNTTNSAANIMVNFFRKYQEQRLNLFSSTRKKKKRKIELPAHLVPLLLNEA